MDDQRDYVEEEYNRAQVREEAQAEQDAQDNQLNEDVTELLEASMHCGLLGYDQSNRRFRPI